MATRVADCGSRHHSGRGDYLRVSVPDQGHARRIDAASTRCLGGRFYIAAIFEDQAVYCDNAVDRRVDGQRQNGFTHSVLDSG